METDHVQPERTLLDGELSAEGFDDRESLADKVVTREDSNRQRVESELLTLRKAVETSGEVIFLTNREGVITYVNPEFTRLYGYHSEEVVGKTSPRILKSGMMTARDYEQFWETLLKKQVVNGEYTNRCKDGRIVTVEGSANPILDEQSNIIGFLAIQRDITQRVLAAEKIGQRNEELATLNAIASTVSQTLDLNQLVNDALDEVLQLRMFGGAAKGMVFRLGEEFDELVLIAHRGAPEDHPCLTQPPQIGECLCGRAAQQGKVFISEDCMEDDRHDRHWQTMPEHKDICLPLKVRGEVLGVMNLRLPITYEVSSRDVELLTSAADQIGVAIENARLFEAISQQHERLRSLNSLLAEAEENERRRLARELHDQVGTKLTALGINLNIIRMEIDRNRSQNVYSRLVESQELVERTTQLIRGVMSDLRPPMLDDLGLVDTLRWYGDQFVSRTGIAVTIKSGDFARPLPIHIESVLFRITQESLTNVAKHAQATEVTISMELDQKNVRLVVADNGLGYRPNQLVKPAEDKGWGLLIMTERAEAVGGRCWTESRPSKEGLRVVVEIPL